MKFDPDIEHQKVRTYGKGVRYHQKGHEFTSGFADLGKIKAGKTREVVEEATENTSFQDVRARAAEKLEGFKKPEVTESVALALDENAAAAAAEEANV